MAPHQPVLPVATPKLKYIGKVRVNQLSPFLFDVLQVNQAMMSPLLNFLIITKGEVFYDFSNNTISM